MSDPFVGEIMMFGGNFPIRNWAQCDGQMLPISQNQALFAILGTKYGGDGRTTLGVPELRGRVPMHWGDGPGLSSYWLGQKGGAQSHVLLTNEIPAHNHSSGTLSLYAEAAPGSSATPNNNMLSLERITLADGTNVAVQAYAPEGGTPDFKLHSNSVQGDTGNTGGTQAHDIRQPYTTVNFLLSLQGVFPSRN